MVAINLFHKPSFKDKVNLGLSDSSTAVYMQALLAAMLAYAIRFFPNIDESVASSFSGDASHALKPDHLLDLAFNSIEKALRECDDETPPLCLLQGLIIATHCQLTRGVRGKAWRSLGTSIRVAYELNLHLVDADHSSKVSQNLDPHKWCEDEERRRAWWAIWEMDVFASTIRRMPPAVDWAQMETLLPVDDWDWYAKKPYPSCFMERDPLRRWKSLQQSGNQSPKAWFLVINSLMKDAQIISSPRSIPSSQGSLERCESFNRLNTMETKGFMDEAAKKLELIANAVQCFVMALPAHLLYRGEYLAFERSTSGEPTANRQLCCGIYNIYVMTQLARLMIHRYEVFKRRGPSHRRAAQSRDTSSDFRCSNVQSSLDTEKLSLRQYFEASDNILSIINRSHEDHICFINPFLSSTIWLASAIQLVRLQFARDENSRALVNSKFEVLNLTYKRCVSFWGIQTALQQNLETLQVQLEGLQDPSIAGRNCHSTRTFANGKPQSSPELQRGSGTTINYPPDQRFMNKARTEDSSGSSSAQNISTEPSHSDHDMMFVADLEDLNSDVRSLLPQSHALQTPPPSICNSFLDKPQDQTTRQHNRRQSHLSQDLAPIGSSSGRSAYESPDIMNTFLHSKSNFLLSSQSSLEGRPLSTVLIDDQNTIFDSQNQNSRIGVTETHSTAGISQEQMRGADLVSHNMLGTAEYWPEWPDISLPNEIHELLSGLSGQLE